MNSNACTVIVGAGQAGGRAALMLRENNYQGDIHIIGSETYPPYNRPPLSKAVLLGEKPFEKTQLNSKNGFAEKNISLHLDCTASAIDIDTQKISCLSGNEYNYSDLIIATGSSPRELKCSGSQLRGISTFRTVDDSLNLADKLKPGTNLVIVGGGFIGLEIAASAISLGCKVTVLEAQQRLLSRSMPEHAAGVVTQIHQGQGVEILTDVSISEFEGSDKVESILLADGLKIPADLVVIGIGIIPNTALADQAGLKTDNGIVTDKYTQTSNHKIYAIGDCASPYLPRYERHIRLESSQNADLMATTAAKSITGKLQPYDPVPWLWSQQYNWIIQTAGFTDGADQIITRGSITDEKVLYIALKDDKIHGVVGIGRGAAIAKEVRLAQLLIEKDILADIKKLQNPNVDLGKLLAT